MSQEEFLQARRRSVQTAAAVALTLGIASAPLASASAQESRAAPAVAELFVFLYRPGPAWREGAPFSEQGLGPHGAYMSQLLDAGRLFAGGGFADQDGGMAIVIASSLEEARRLLAADPAVTSGIFVAEVEHWRPRFRTDRVLPR